MGDRGRREIAAALDAIQSGAVPSSVLDLATMEVAAVSWNSLAQLARQAVTTTGTPGTPVFITTDRTQATFSSSPS